MNFLCCIDKERVVHNVLDSCHPRCRGQAGFGLVDRPQSESSSSQTWLSSWSTIPLATGVAAAPLVEPEYTDDKALFCLKLCLEGRVVVAKSPPVGGGRLRPPGLPLGGGPALWSDLYR